MIATMILLRAKVPDEGRVGGDIVCTLGKRRFPSGEWKSEQRNQNVKWHRCIVNICVCKSKKEKNHEIGAKVNSIGVE